MIDLQQLPIKAYLLCDTIEKESKLKRKKKHRILSIKIM